MMTCQNNLSGINHWFCHDLSAWQNNMIIHRTHNECAHTGNKESLMFADTKIIKIIVFNLVSFNLFLNEPIKCIFIIVVIFNYFTELAI